MTAQDLYNQIDRRIEQLKAEWQKAALARYVTYRRSILDATRDLWDKAATTGKDPATGQTRYVSRTEALKYGRLDKTTENIRATISTGSRADVRSLEATMIASYQDELIGAAWVYNQGFGLPITSGPKVPLIAEALTSDLYGDTFDRFLLKHWATFQDDILAATRRGLNQGISYTRLAQQIAQFTDSLYARALRVARTEAGRMQSLADLDSYDLLTAAGVDFRKVWFKQANGPGRENREDHWAMDGRRADENGIFTLPSGATGPAPRLTTSAGDNINCGCSMITEINGELPEQRRVDRNKLIPFEEYSRGKRVSVSEVRRAARG